MKVVIKHKLLIGAAKNLQTINDIVSVVAGQERIDIVAKAAKDLAKKKFVSSKAVKISNNPQGETLTVVLNDEMLLELLESQGDLLKGVAWVALPIKVYIDTLARINNKYDKKGSF